MADETVRRAQGRVGTTLNGKWTIDALLGVGGMACVYAATHRNAKRAAIKVLHPELSFHSDIRARFVREGYVANTVGHPGAVSVLDDDVAQDGAAFIVMELLEGETVLARAERKGGRLSSDDVLSIADQLLDVLVAAHAKGIVHRDIKPENLFLDGSGQLKVLDFGIARLRETNDQSGTRTGSLMGTPSFMPPEQARGLWDQVDARTDLWAVGATMFTLLTGRVVHAANTANEALALAITQRAPSLAAVMPAAPPRLVTLVDRALAYERDDRYSDAAAMQFALRETYAALHDEPESEGLTKRLPALSLPDVAGDTAILSWPTPVDSLEASKPRLQVVPAYTPVAASGGGQTTTRGIESAPRPVEKRGRAVAPLVGAAALVVLLVVGLGAVLLGRRTPEGATSVASGQTATAPATAEALTPTAEPSATPPVPTVAPLESGVVAIDQLPAVVENAKTSQARPASKPAHAPAAKPAKHEPTPPIVTPVKPEPTPPVAQPVAPPPKPKPTATPTGTDRLGGRL